jgi:hypothetical protein
VHLLSMPQQRALPPLAPVVHLSCLLLHTCTSPGLLHTYNTTASPPPHTQSHAHRISSTMLLSALSMCHTPQCWHWQNTAPRAHAVGLTRRAERPPAGGCVCTHTAAAAEGSGASGTRLVPAAVSCRCMSHATLPPASCWLSSGTQPNTTPPICVSVRQSALSTHRTCCR